MLEGKVDQWSCENKARNKCKKPCPMLLVEWTCVEYIVYIWTATHQEPFMSSQQIHQECELILIISE